MSLPITTITLDHVEADDIMSYIATHTAEQGGQSILYSTDKDFLQLVNDNITIWHPMKKKTYTADLVLEEHKIHPNNFLLYRSLIGDNSDNISGIKGIGTKTLLKHIPQFAEEQKITLDELMDVAQASKSKVMKKIVDSIDIIERNLYLMSLSSVNMSANNKMTVLNRVQEDEVILDKDNLTNLLKEYNVLPAIQNYDFWLQQTFLPLMRFNGRL
jgi:DNA polymerase-1